MISPFSRFASSSSCRVPAAVGLLWVLAMGGAATAAGQTELTVQAKARPFGLDIAAPVMAAGSDAAAATFQAKDLPAITNLINTQLGESVQFQNQTAFSLDPTKLLLATASTARVYFVGEGAGYRNTLGFNALPAGSPTPARALTADSQLIFPDASSSVSTYDPATKAKRTGTAPLLPGDFVDLGTFAAGTTLDFFVIADGASGGRNSYAAPATRNPDQLNHVVAFVLPDSPFLIVGFEDLFGGGDKDYNDVVFAIDIGSVNLQKLISTPEPGTWAILFGCLGLVAWVARQRRGANLDTV